LFKWVYAAPNLSEITEVLFTGEGMSGPMTTSRTLRGSLTRGLLAQMRKTLVDLRLSAEHLPSLKRPTAERTQSFLSAFISQLYSVQVVKIIGVVWYICFPNVVRVTTGIFDCQSVANVRYVTADFSTVCGTKTWYLHVLPAVIVLALYVVPPVYCLLRWSRVLERSISVNSQGRVAATRLNSELHNNSLLQLKAGFFIDGYIEAKWWFTFGVDTLIKLFASLVIPHLPRESQTTVFTCTIWFYVAWLLWHDPYERKADDGLHLGTLFVVGLCSLLPYLYSEIGHAKSEIGFLNSGSDKIGLVLLFMSIGLCIASFIYLVLRVLWWRFARLRHKAQVSEALVLHVLERPPRGSSLDPNVTQ